MRVQLDDRLYQVNNVWLGPADVPVLRDIFQFAYARYPAYGIGFVLFVLVSLLQRQMGIGAGVVSFVVAVVVAVVLTRLVGVMVTHERPVAAVLGMFVADLTAPRHSSTVRGLVAAPRRRRRRLDRQRELGGLVTEERVSDDRTQGSSYERTHADD